MPHLLPLPQAPEKLCSLIQAMLTSLCFTDFFAHGLHPLAAFPAPTLLLLFKAVSKGRSIPKDGQHIPRSPREMM